MKKLFLTLAVAATSLLAYSQVPLVNYTPVRVESNHQQGNSYQYNSYQQNSFQQQNIYQQRSSQPQKPSYPTTGAYYIDKQTNRFVRVKIRYSVVDNGYGQETVYLKGLYFSSNQSWLDYNTVATNINTFTSAPAIIKENFEWQVGNTYYGTLYFLAEAKPWR